MIILVFGLRRSGNHYIIYWLLKNLARRPISEFERWDEKTTSVAGIQHDSGLFHAERGIYFYNNCYPQFEEIDRIDTDKTEIFSFEDLDLTRVPKMRRVDSSLLILRCPLNLLASHYQRQSSFPQEYESLIPIYQREFLNETSFLPNKLCVNYNRFHSEHTYTRRFARKFNINPILDLETIPPFGRGSSFVGTEFDRLKDMNTRYKKFTHNPDFRSVIARLATQPETVRRTIEIFGYDLKEELGRMNAGERELDQYVSPSALDLSSVSFSDDSNPVGKPAIERRTYLIDAEVPTYRKEQAEEFHHLYQTQSCQRMDTIQKLYSELGKPNHLIVMLFCGKYLPLFKNWLLSCSRNDIYVRNRTIAFCLDAESATISKELGIKTYFIDPDVYPQAGHCELFGDASFRKTMLYKNAVMLDALQLGATVLFQDTDLIWFKDPFLYLKNHNDEYDIQIMYDGPNRLCKPLHANTGFIYLQPNAITKAALETALYNSASILFVGGHQVPFNQILHHFIQQKLLRLQVLPQHLFLNGHLFNRTWGVSPEAKNWKEEGIVLHYSWTGTMLEKVQKLEKFDLNYLGPNINDEPTQSATQAEDNSDTDRSETIEAPTQKTTEPGPGRVNLTLYITGQEPLYLTCNQNAPILRILFNTLLGKRKGSRNSLIHLQIDDDEGSKDIYLRSTRLNAIETEPSLPADLFQRLDKTHPPLMTRTVGFLKRSVKRIVPKRKRR